MNWVDVTLLVIVGWSAWRGLATGLVEGVARLVGLFLGLLVAYNYYRPLAGYLNDQWHLADKVKGFLPFPSASWTDSVSLPALWRAQGLNLPEGLAGSNLHGQQVLSVVEKLQHSLAQGLMETGAFILIFLVVSSLTYFLGALAARAARWTFLGPVDRFGGLMLGLVRGLVVVLVLVALQAPLQAPVSLFSGGQQESWLARSFQQSAVIPVCWQLLVKLQGIYPGLLLNTGLPGRDV